MIVSSKLSFALIIALALFVHGSDAQSVSKIQKFSTTAMYNSDFMTDINIR